MEEKGKLLFESEWKEVPLRVFENGVETYFLSTAGYFGSKRKVDFRNVDTISAIYPFEWRKEDVLFNSGIQIETTDNRIAIISFNEHKEDEVMGSLKKLLGKGWRKTYKKKEHLEKYKSPGKMGQVGIHHSWTYKGIFKGWG